MIVLSDVVTRIHRQLRLTPLITEDQIVDWIAKAVQYISPRAIILTTWTMIVGKSGEQRYLLPADHISTVGLYYNGVRLETCNAFDVQLVSPTTPTFYYEEDWHHEASMATQSEFTTHYALNELWPLQLMRSQNSYGRKVFTVTSAPTADGDTPIGGAPVVGIFMGTLSDDSIHWPNPLGAPVYIAPLTNNFLLIYKYVDFVPTSTADICEWSNMMGVLYSMKACAMSLETETDEYDRFFSWLYGYVCDSLTSMLRSISITRQFV